VKIMRVRAACVLVALTLLAARPSAQQPSIDALMERVAVYVHRFVDQFSNVVADEQFVPDRIVGTRQRLRSDYLLVRYPGSDSTFLTFRDVVEANGIAVGDQQGQLSTLFLQQFESAVQQANAITRHSAKYLSPLSDPLLGIALLQRGYQPRFRYTLGDMEVSLGPGVRRIRFDETRSPTILRRSNPDRDLVTHGAAWVVESTGRVVKTELEVGIGRTVTTTFRVDEALQIDVPAQMHESYRNQGMLVRGMATYTRFRRFAVRTEEAIESPSR
jgi:hypothetical protein